MSSNLMWEPIVDRGKSLSDDLKFLLRTGFTEPVDRIVDCDDVPYLSGLRDASNGSVHRELQRLIDAIRKHAAIRVWEQY